MKNQKFDLRLIVVLLLMVIAAMLLLWRPWSSTNPDAKNRTITVSGEAKIRATPDEFVFSPSYQFKNPDKAKALAEVTQKSNEVVKKLKGLGVADNKIKTNADGQNYAYYHDDSSNQNNYTLQLTVSVGDKKLAQKVQDYLVTTAPTGNISSRAAFSEGKRKQLENQARDQATSDARAKAERTAKNLGVSLGKVKSITDNSPIGIGGPGPLPLVGVVPGAPPGAPGQPPGLDLQPGQNELPYSITVVYYLNG